MMRKEMKRGTGLLLTLLLVLSTLLSPLGSVPMVEAATLTDIGSFQSYAENGNILTIASGGQEVRLELCTSRTVRIQLSVDGSYRGDDPLYYMVQKNEWDLVEKTIVDEENSLSVKTADLEIRIQKSPLRVGMYDLQGNLLSKDADSQGMYWTDGSVAGVKKTEGSKNAGGIFGFGSGDHGRAAQLNRYSMDMTDFSMDHGQVIAPFFMSTVGYGIFLNTLETNTKFFKQGGGFETGGYLDYYFMYGPDFKTILNEYAEITGRMELYGKWAHGFMLSKYGADNATQAEFIQWIERLRAEDYPTDCYVFDYGWRQNGAKWGAHHWDTSGRYPDLASMFARADELGFKVGLHNNKGTPEAANGRLWVPENNKVWVDAHIENVIKPGYGDWFWPDEFDIKEGSTAFNYMPTFSAKGPYEAWKEYTVESRPMFITRGSYAGQHFATAWSGDINNTVAEMGSQIGFSIDTGLIGYWTSSHDLGGFMSKPNNELYTRWVAEFGAWNGIMRTHGHDGREPWLYNATAQNTLRQNLKIRYALYPYTYSLAWQGYSQGVPMMRAMLLEDNSQYNAAAWSLNEQYYYGDWFLVAPALSTSDTTVRVWLPPETTWYNYATGKRYEGGASGKTITVAAALDEIPVFVKSGAIIPMGPDVDYADEKPLDPLTLDIYPKGVTTFTLYEDDGESRRYLTENAYSTTAFESVQSGSDISFKIHAREDHNAAVYQPVERSYNLKFNHLKEVSGVSINGRTAPAAASLADYNSLTEGYWLDSANSVLYVKTPDTGKEINVSLASGGIVEPELGAENEAPPLPSVSDGSVYELENGVMSGVTLDTEWKGYTGSGFAKGFKSVNNSVEAQVNVKQAGVYNLILRVNNGKKNDNTDKSPRTAGVYLNGKKVQDLAFAVTPVWGDTINSVKQGVWSNYVIQNVVLSEGENYIKISAEGSNPGNFNLDSLTFQLTSTPAFAPIQGEWAAQLSQATLLDLPEASGGKAIGISAGGWAQFNDVKGERKNAVILRVRSQTGGQLFLQENGIGDKVLATIDLPADGNWRTLRVESKNTDAITSNVFLELRGEDVSCELDWFQFQTEKSSVNAYNKIEAESAAKRVGIGTASKSFDGVQQTYINGIENSDWAMYSDVNFGQAGSKEFSINYACGLQGGKVEVYIDSLLGGKKIAEVTLTNTSSDGTTAGWNILKTLTAACEKVTGIHDVYLHFVNMDTARSISDVNWLSFTASPDREVQQVAALSDLTVDFGTPAEQLPLPATVQLTLSDGSTEWAQVTWSSDDYDGSQPGSYSFTGSIVEVFGVTNPLALTAQATVTVAELHELTGPQEVIKNEVFLLTLRSSQPYDKLTVYNENDRFVSSTVVSREENTDGSYTTVLRLSVGTPGDNRTLNVYSGEKKLASHTFQVLPIPTGIQSISAPETVAVNETFEVTVVITSDLIKIKFFNESGGVLGSTRTVRSFQGDLLIVTYEMKIGTAGSRRTITVKADYDKQNDFPFAASFDLEVLPKA